MSFDVEKNISRVIHQIKNGDRAMSFLAVYSFIEGYFRSKYGYYEYELRFNQILEYISDSDNKSPIDPKREKELFADMEIFHGKPGIRPEETGTNTNNIRHRFDNIKLGSIWTIIKQFQEFALLRDFKNEVPELYKDIENLDLTNEVKDIYNTIQNYPESDSVLYLIHEDLFDKYHELMEILQKLSNIRNLIDELNLRNSSIITGKITGTEIEELRNNSTKLLSAKDEYDELLKKYEEFEPYNNYINELAINLIEARTKKSYDSKTMRLSSTQLEIINKDIHNLPNRPGKSMYLKGGPGTGKTLVLIAAIFRLIADDEDPLLLTYYPTLNKFISHLFNNFNKYEFLNQIKIPEIILEQQIKNLNEKCIKTFEEHMFPIMKVGLNKKDFYSVNNDKRLLLIFESVVSDKRKAKRRYFDAINKVWPNLLKKEDFDSSDRARKQWEVFEKVHSLLDKESEIPDLYAYYAFAESDIQIYRPDKNKYILVDEAQDLNNAQIKAVGKLLTPDGGVILAGDPSQEIRNTRISMKSLGIDITGGGNRYSQELKTNYRSSELIQNLGNNFKEHDCLHINKSTASVDAITAGPPPQLYILDDYNEKITFQIKTSIEMCINSLNITPSNICVVAFNEESLINIKNELSKVDISSGLIYNSDKPWDGKDEVVKLCTVDQIKGIDCAVLIFMLSKSDAVSSRISDELRANAIYTCITRAMYLLQVFVPKELVKEDISTAVLVNLINPDDEDSKELIEKYRRLQKIFNLKEYREKNNKLSEEQLRIKFESEIREHCVELKIIDEAEENIDFEWQNDDETVLIYVEKEVVENVNNGFLEISLYQAQQINPNYQIGNKFRDYLDHGNFTDILKNEEKREKKENTLVDILSGFIPGQKKNRANEIENVVNNPVQDMSISYKELSYKQIADCLSSLTDLGDGYIDCSKLGSLLKEKYSVEDLNLKELLEKDFGDKFETARDFHNVPYVVRNKNKKPYKLSIKKTAEINYDNCEESQILGRDNEKEVIKVESNLNGGWYLPTFKNSLSERISNIFDESVLSDEEIIHIEVGYEVRSINKKSENSQAIIHYLIGTVKELVEHDNGNFAVITYGDNYKLKVYERRNKSKLYSSLEKGSRVRFRIDTYEDKDGNIGKAGILL